MIHPFKRWKTRAIPSCEILPVFRVLGGPAEIRRDGIRFLAVKRYRSASVNAALGPKAYHIREWGKVVGRT